MPVTAAQPSMLVADVLSETSLTYRTGFSLPWQGAGAEHGLGKTTERRFGY